MLQHLKEINDIREVRRLKPLTINLLRYEKNCNSLFSVQCLFALVSYSQGIDNDNFVVTHGPWLQNLTSSGVTIAWTTNKPAIPGISLTGPDGIKKIHQEQPYRER